MVNVTIGGNATDILSGVDEIKTTLKIEDECSKVSSTTPDFDLGSAVPLEAWRQGSDLDGRQYMITVTATDYAGNSADREFVVIVPHHMRTKTNGGKSTELSTWSPFIIYGNSPYPLDKRY